MMEPAFAQVIREHDAWLTGIAYRLCGNAADAAGLVHDTYEHAVRGWERDSDRGDLRSWMVAILGHLFIDRCRKTRRAPSEPIGNFEIAAPEPGVARAWPNVTRPQLDAALATIAAELRRVYELHVLGRSYAQIAAELSLTKATVGARLIRARNQLKRALRSES